jgi:hypothetical protein
LIIAIELVLYLRRSRGIQKADRLAKLVTETATPRLGAGMKLAADQFCHNVSLLELKQYCLTKPALCCQDNGKSRDNTSINPGLAQAFAMCLISEASDKMFCVSTLVRLSADKNMCELFLRCLEIEMVNIKLSKEVCHKFSDLAKAQFCRKVQMSLSNGEFIEGVEELDSKHSNHDKELQMKLRKISFMHFTYDEITSRDSSILFPRI